MKNVPPVALAIDSSASLSTGTGIGSDRDCRFQRKLAGESAQPMQHCALFFRKKLVAPVKCGAKRLMAR